MIDVSKWLSFLSVFVLCTVFGNVAFAGSMAGSSNDNPEPTFNSTEIGTVFPKDIEIECISTGDVTFVLTVTNQTLGLDMPSTDTLHIMDVSLFTPDGELFGHQRVNGTRVSFQVSADTSPTPLGTWKMTIH